MKRKRITKPIAEALAKDVSNKLTIHYDSCEKKVVQSIINSRDYKKLISMQEKLDKERRDFDYKEALQREKIDELKETIVRKCNMPVVDISIMRHHNKGVKVKYYIPTKEFIVDQLLVLDYFTKDEDSIEQIIDKTVDKILKLREEIEIKRMGL